MRPNSKLKNKSKKEKAHKKSTSELPEKILITESSESINLVTQTLTPNKSNSDFPIIRIPRVPESKTMAEPSIMNEEDARTVPSVSYTIYETEGLPNLDEVRVC